MSESDEINPLIRLKRYENPPAEFVEEFVRSFQDRQRSELLRQSARSLLWERITTYFDELSAPKWGAAFGGLVAVASLAYMLRPVTPSSVAQAPRDASPTPDTYIVKAIYALPNTQAANLVDERNLISRHYDSGFAKSADITHPQGAFLQAVALNDDIRLYPR